MNRKIISEVFTSIQGEGLRTGIKSDFIRFLGCNLRCGFCDTPYTSWELEEGLELDYVLSYLETSDSNDVVITGGEPCLYPYELKKIIGHCSNKIITLETNGTIVLPVDEMAEIDLVSLSPKLSNSIPIGNKWDSKHDKLRINIESLVRWISIAKDYQLKFVVSNDDDLREVEDILSKIDSKVTLLRSKIWLMPEGKTEEELQKKRVWLANKCIELNYRYCERLHIVVFGNKRGV